MTGKVVIVTGANAGIGKVSALKIAEMGATVVMICRDPVRGENARKEIAVHSGNSAVHLLIADLSSQNEIHRAADEFISRFERLDVLLNNAGAIFGNREITKDGYEMTFALNHLGYFLLTHRLLPLLNRSAPARIVNVASTAHYSGIMDFDDLMGEKNYGDWKAYRQSKLANVLFTFELARRLEGANITVNCLHPGVVATNFGRGGSVWLRTVWPLAPLVLLTPERGAGTSIYLATSPKVEGLTGRYYSDMEIKEPSPESRNRDTALRLWEISERLTGIPANGYGVEH